MFVQFASKIANRIFDRSFQSLKALKLERAFKDRNSAQRQRKKILRSPSPTKYQNVGLLSKSVRDSRYALRYSPHDHSRWCTCIERFACVRYAPTSPSSRIRSGTGGRLTRNTRDSLIVWSCLKKQRFGQQRLGWQRFSLALEGLKLVYCYILVEISVEDG